jgi:2-polyprenyl-3-methyl-5-hydroxy-6-metoxy-1,4-benzoquinol methylase
MQFMAQASERTTSGRDQYQDIYTSELEAQAQWLSYGAVHKVDSVEILLNRHAIAPISVLELGCGTGAVITECQKRGLGAKFTAVDYSREAIAYLESRSSGIQCVSADITDPTFELHGSFDVVVLSHVLEHLEQPLEFLQSLIRKVQIQYLVAEVPLEDLLAFRLKNLFRDRYKNRAGHVQFFTEETFQQLLSQAGLRLLDHRRYAPVYAAEEIDFVCAKDGQTGIRRAIRKATGCYLPRVLSPLWSRIYYGHYAALCVPLGK